MCPILESTITTIGGEVAGMEGSAEKPQYSVDDPLSRAAWSALVKLDKQV
jgi:hypothetical protein